MARLGSWWLWWLVERHALVHRAGGSCMSCRPGLRLRLSRERWVTRQKPAPVLILGGVELHILTAIKYCEDLAAEPDQDGEFAPRSLRKPLEDHDLPECLSSRAVEDQVAQTSSWVSLLV